MLFGGLNPPKQEERSKQLLEERFRIASGANWTQEERKLEVHKYLSFKQKKKAANLKPFKFLIERLFFNYQIVSALYFRSFI